jgi:hypothetical protein
MPDLRFIRDLEAFEGPILTELRTARGVRYLQKWCMFHGGASRSLVVRSDPRSIALFLSKRMTMLDLLTRPNDDVGFVVDRTEGGLHGVQLVQVSTLPDSYLPEADAFHDDDLRPRWKQTPQTFLVDDNWNPKLLSDLERDYLNAYAFTYFLDTAEDREVPGAALNYVLQGYSYGKMFGAFRRAVPDNDNAHAEAMAAASPAVLTLSAPTASADRLILAIHAAEREETIKAYKALHEWSRFRVERFEEVPETAEDQFRRLAQLLLVDASRLLPKDYDHADLGQRAQLLNAGKTIAAYHRMLRNLHRSRKPGVEFIAPGIDDEERGSLRTKSEDDSTLEEEEDYEDEEEEDEEEDDEEDDSPF